MNIKSITDEKVVMCLIFTHSNTLLNLQKEDEERNYLSGLYTKLFERIGCKDVGQEGCKPQTAGILSCERPHS